MTTDLVRVVLVLFLAAVLYWSCREFIRWTGRVCTRHRERFAEYEVDRAVVAEAYARWSRTGTR